MKKIIIPVVGPIDKKDYMVNILSLLIRSCQHNNIQKACIIIPCKQELQKIDLGRFFGKTICRQLILGSWCIENISIRLYAAKEIRYIDHPKIVLAWQIKAKDIDVLVMKQLDVLIYKPWTDEEMNSFHADSSLHLF